MAREIYTDLDLKNNTIHNAKNILEVIVVDEEPTISLIDGKWQVQYKENGIEKRTEQTYNKQFIYYSDTSDEYLIKQFTKDGKTMPISGTNIHGKNSKIEVKYNTDYNYTLKISYYNENNELVTFETPNLRVDKILGIEMKDVIVNDTTEKHLIFKYADGTEKDAGKLSMNIEVSNTISKESTDNEAVSAKAVYDKLYKTITETIIDTPEHYELASVQDGTIGLKIVNDGTMTDVSTEIELSTVQAKLLETDTHSYAIDEYVVLVDEVNHEESHDEEIYARVEQIPDGAELMTVQEWNTYFDNLVITASGYVEDTTTP